MMVDEKDLLNKMVRRITEKYPTNAIILFGSRARGNYKPRSDYDLLIIADFKEKPRSYQINTRPNSWYPPTY